MGGLGNSTSAFKLYEASIIPALLHNCESWIGKNDKHLKSLQDFQEKFITKLLRLTKSTPKAILKWDIGLQPMKWRIAYKKIVFLQKMLGKDQYNICKIEEVSNGIHGLAYECKQICHKLEIPDMLGTFAPKTKIKSSIFLKMNESALYEITRARRTIRATDKTFYNIELKDI